MSHMIRIQATGEFPFTFYIEKATAVEEPEGLFIQGIASTLNVDHDNERMAESALESMANIINTEAVPLRVEHSKDDNAIVGKVFKAWIDERKQLWIKAALDVAHPAAKILHGSLKNGAKLGLSVGGRIKNAVKELAESTGKMVQTFYDVALDEVSVTQSPANYDAWLVAKSIKTKDEDVSPYYRSGLYNEFLSENAQLDYMKVLQKSIPSNQWKKVQLEDKSIDTKSMDTKEKEVKEKASEEKEEESKEKATEGAKEEIAEEKEEREEAAEKSVSRAEFDTLKSMFSKGFSALSNLVAKMSESHTPAMDTTNPDEAKEEEVGDTAEKAREGQEGTAGDGGDLHGEREEKEPTGGEKVDAADQTNPDESKEEQVGDTAKSADGEKEEHEEKAKADDSKENEYGEEYDMDKSFKSALSRIEAVTKRLSGQKEVSKSSKETIEKSSVSEIDMFAAKVATAIETLSERFEKSGTRVPGLTQMIVDMVKTDPEIQKSIASMMKQPGAKKSVVTGVPYVIEKSGRKYALTLEPVADGKQTTEKSAKKDFKSHWKAEHSSYQE